MLIDTNVLSGLIAEAVKTGTIAAYEEMGLHTPDVKSDNEKMSTERKKANAVEIPDEEVEDTEEAKKDAKNEKRRKAAAEKKAVKEEKEANAKAQADEEAKAKANSEGGDLDDELDGDLDDEEDFDSGEEEMTKEEFIKAVKIKYEGKFPVAKALMKKMFGSKYKNFSVMDDAADFKKFLSA